MIIGTEEQERIWKAMAESDDHLVVDAKAGTGKTFTIVEGASRIRNKTKLFLAFNKSIATEIGAKLPMDCEAKTFHSLGMGALKKHNGKAKMHFKKDDDIIKAVMGKDYKSKPGLKRLISLLKSSMIEWDDKDGIENLIDDYTIEFDGIREKNNAILKLPQMKNLSLDVSIFNFDDMIWLPVVLDLPVKHYDVVFVDEAQDFNESQRRLILKACNGGRMIIVGDPKQAIYGFRADSKSMSIFKDTLQFSSREVKEFPLTMTWRCAKAIVKEANRFVKDFKPRSDAEHGEVNDAVDFAPQVGDMVLCRVNAPLVNHCFRLIIAGIPAYVLGRDIGQSLNALIKKVTHDVSMDIATFKDALRQYVLTQVRMLMELEKENVAHGLQDRRDCLFALMGNVQTVNGLMDNIKTVFDDGKKAGVVFSTIHKAKGLEADTVWILKPDLMPHPMAKSKADREQEWNLCYVAITRAKRVLNYCGRVIG
jgi:superfamily I DNA/RNA helicase